MTEAPEPGRRLAAVWFADIVGYTTLSSRDEDGALKVVGAFQGLCEEIVAQHAGRVVKFIGDAALAEFASTDGAIRSALALLERFMDHPEVRPYGSTLRVGVNVGEVLTAPDGDIYGDGVNLASRLQNQAAPGQVIASEAVHAQIRQRPVFRTEPLGQRAVKGIADPVTLYAVQLQEAGNGALITAVGVGAQSKPAPAPATGSRAPRVIGGLLLAAAAVSAVLVLDPGGVVGRFRAEPPVSAAPPTFPVVEGGMVIGGDLTVAFSGAIDPATATSRNVVLTDARGDAVPAEVSVGPEKLKINVAPHGTLAYASAYTLTLSEELRDAEGRPIQGPAGSGGPARFTVRTQPVPAGTLPATAEVFGSVGPNGPVSVRFSEALDPRTAQAGAVLLLGEEGDTLEASMEMSAGNQEVRLVPATGLTRGARYVVLLDSTVATATGLSVVPDTVSFRVVAATPRPATTQPAAATGGPLAGSRRPAGPATLNLTVVPVAASAFLKVVVDGDTLGPPPLKGRSLAAGRAHTVTVVGVPDLSAYTVVVYRREVTPEPGEVLNVSAEITEFGSIDLVSEPGGTVFVDGRQVGRTPLAGFPVTAGVIHRLEIRPTPADAAAFDVFTAEFRVDPLEWKSLGRLALPPKGR